MIKMKNKILILICIIFLLILMPNVVKAAYLNVSAPSSGNPGSSVNVTISSDCIGRFNISVNNGTLNGSNKIWLEASSATFSVTLGKSGSTKITVTPANPVSFNLKDIDLGVQQKNITINSSSSGGSTGGSSTPAKKSSNANLSNLGITPNDFTGFKAGKTTYDVTVPNEVSSVTIYAKKADSKASVSGTGKKSLKEGTNVCKVVVTAEDGTKKTYTINIIRKVAEAETVPNVIDGDGEEEPGQEEIIIGLQTLTIEGLKLDQEFKTDVFEYTSIIEDETMTVEKLKELIKFTLNDETAKSDIEIVEGKEEDDYLYLATISVKDDEKQFSSYKIKFIAKQEEEKPEEVPATTEVVEEKKDDLNSGKTPRLFGLFLLNDTSKNVLKIFACEIVAIIVAIVYVIISYKKTRELDDDDYEDDEEIDDNEFGKMNKYSEDLASQIEENDDVENQDTDVEDNTNEVGKNRKQGYRSLKNSTKIKPGRHF